LYIFPVVLAGMAVPPGLAWFLLVLAVGVYASLFVFAPANLHHHDASAMQAHLLGMWVTVLLVGGLTVFSFGRMRAQMAALDRRLHNARELEARNTRLGALATLAAGAAHELATPLSTILLVAREMQRTAAHARQRDDADLVASEVLRCQDVLAQLSANAGEGLGEAPSRTHLAPYLAEALVPIADPRVTVQAQDKTVFLPSRLVAQVVRRLVGNALAASGPKEPVTVAAHVEGLTLEICVKDQGVGMPPEVLARAGEPFFTTRPPGEGRGLGLYFARSVATGLGGALDITSAPGRGTTVRFSVPVELA
jgi:two-component system sensor histidine kinase RegB